MLVPLPRLRRRSKVAIAAVLLLLFQPSTIAPLRADDEVRALWVVRTTLTSPSAIESMVRQAQAGGFNTLLVQIRGRGDAYYQNAREPRPPALDADPNFDPLATTIARAHAAGLQVHAWINVNLVSSATDLPAARNHVVYRHPEWLMVPRTLVEDLSGVDSRSPEYLGRLSRSIRQRADVEGLYLSPISKDAADYTVTVVRDIAERYDIDGVHFDYIRYPAEDFDYSAASLAAFRTSVIPDLGPADQRRYDTRLVDDPLMYTEAFPERWRTFRSGAVTSLLARLKQTVRSVRPMAKVSAAVGPDPNDAATNRFQDWREWLRQDLIDIVCPMAYTTDSSTFAAQVARARDLAGDHPIWVGIGAYHLSSEQIVDNVQAARRIGVGGIILFSYDSLTESSHGPDYLAQVGRAAFNTR
jgi:uncharacterized lipoprotein YddW (UPF0748 family)